MTKKRHKNTIEERNARIETFKQMIDEFRQKEAEYRKIGDNASADHVHNKHLVKTWKDLAKELSQKQYPLLVLAREMGYDIKPLVQIIIKVHLTADYMTDLLGRAQEILEGMGAERCNFYDIVDSAFKQLQFLASMMAGDKNEALTDLIVDDDDLLKTLDKDVDKYLKKRGMSPDMWIKAQEQYVQESKASEIKKENLARWQRKRKEQEKAM